MRIARLLDFYRKNIKSSLKKEFGYKNDMEIPALTKVVLNMGVGEASLDKKKIQGAVNDMTAISGQKPVIKYAKKSEAGFKLREGMPVGVKVTLRGARMYDFLDRLTTIAMPRIRDFRGLNKKSFDGNGNYAFGITEQLIFPEIEYDKMDVLRGMDIVVCSTAKTDKEAKALLTGFNFPFN